jgi:hypothetical protein
LQFFTRTCVASMASVVGVTRVTTATSATGVSSVTYAPMPDTLTTQL